MRWPYTLSFTSAGSFWASYSWWYFLNALGTRYFVWRSARGARLIIDLEAEELVTEDEARDAGLEPHFVERESADALQLLSKFAQNADAIQIALRSANDDLWEREPLRNVWKNSCGLVLAAAHKLTVAIPFLRALERIEWPCSSTRSNAFVTYFSIETSWVRPLVQHALRVLDAEPVGFPAYYFVDDDEKRLPVPVCVPNRNERAKQLTRKVTALDVLQLLGAPDFVASRSRPVETKIERAEHWEYDFRTATGWVTLRLTWGGGQLLAFAEGPAAWLESDEREQELLRY